MYIPEFWCGVFATLGTEFIALIIYCMIMNWEKRNGKN